MTTSPVYDTIGRDYTVNRRPDPRWEAVVATQLGDARRILNVGAGTGSYEPAGPDVVAVEPSTVMLSQRPAGAAAAMRASASALPVRTGWAEVAMAILTVHHWEDWARGLEELCRVAPRRVVLGIDFDRHAEFWLLQEYLPDVRAHTLRCAPSAEVIAEAIGATECIELPAFRDLQDGVLGAHWSRPEAYLDPTVRANNSGTALADPAQVAVGIARLQADLSSGAWHERHADLLELESIDMGYRLLVSG
jgi:SAM-dependent methyltransferase